MSLPDFPPLNALRFFEAAARHGSFAAAARELRVTPASVSYRVKTVERHLGTTLFLRFAHGVRLNPQGKAYLKDIQRIFADFNHATERHRHRRKTPLLKLVAIEVVAEKWLMPQLAHFKTLHPDIAIEFEVDHGDVDPGSAGFRRLDSLCRRGTRHGSFGEAARGDTVSRLQSEPAPGPGPAPETKGFTCLAARLRPSLDHRLVPLVRSSRRGIRGLV